MFMLLCCVHIFHADVRNDASIHVQIYDKKVEQRESSWNMLTHFPLYHRNTISWAKRYRHLNHRIGAISFYMFCVAVCMCARKWCFFLFLRELQSIKWFVFKRTVIANKLDNMSEFQTNLFSLLIRFSNPLLRRYWHVQTFRTCIEKIKFIYIYNEYLLWMLFVYLNILASPILPVCGVQAIWFTSFHWIFAKVGHGLFYCRRTLNADRPTMRCDLSTVEFINSIHVIHTDTQNIKCVQNVFMLLINYNL